MDKKRCLWVPLDDPIYVEYHDNQWGVPVHDDYTLFEMLILEGMQAGLSWITILKKRENFREAFDNFYIDKIISYDEKKIEKLMQNPGIIRNRRKIEATIKNAKAFREIQKEYGSFDKYIWGYVNNTPLRTLSLGETNIPANTKLSDDISKDLKKRGFTFVGSTIIYSYMQSIGLVNDHIDDCFCMEK